MLLADDHSDDDCRGSAHPRHRPGHHRRRAIRHRAPGARSTSETCGSATRAPPSRACSRRWSPPAISADRPAASTTTPRSAPSTSCRRTRTSSSTASSAARLRWRSTSGPTRHRSSIHTPPPAPGAVDLLGYPLSFVATSGPDAPPLPANSGSGKRVVYRARRSAGVGGRQEQPGHSLVAGLGQQVQQRDARHSRGVQPSPRSRRRGTARRTCRT